MQAKYVFSGTLLVLFLLQYNVMVSQTDPKTTFTERYIDRPLTLHKNNLEFTFGYQFGALYSVFDENGKPINLSEAGIAESNQMTSFYLTYGIFERFQVQSFVSYFSYKKTAESIVHAGLGNKLIEVEGIKTSKGFFDPTLRINYLLIENKRKISISLGGGFSLPIAKYKLESPEIDSSGSDRIYYQIIYKYHNGFGTSVHNLNFALKYRFGSISGSDLASKINIRVFADYYTAPSAVLTNDWSYVFDAGNPNGYTFQSLSMKHREGDWLSTHLYIDYQAFTIASFMLGISNRYYFHGWNQTDFMKVAEKDVSETSLSLGAHIQATPRLRFDENLSLPISGKNTESNFYCQIALIYKIL